MLSATTLDRRLSSSTSADDKAAGRCPRHAEPGIRLSLSRTFRPTVTFGRLTSVHLAAAFGGALLLCVPGLARSSCLCQIAWRIVSSNRPGGCLPVWAVAYRFSIQQDFVKAWRNEQTFWTGVLQQAPDMTDGTIILVSRPGLAPDPFYRNQFLGRSNRSWSKSFSSHPIGKLPRAFSSCLRLGQVGGPRGGPAPLARSRGNVGCPLGGSAQFKCSADDAGKRQPGPSIRIHHDPPAATESEAVASAAPSAWTHGALYPLLISGTLAPRRRRLCRHARAKCAGTKRPVPISRPERAPSPAHFQVDRRPKSGARSARSAPHSRA